MDRRDFMIQMGGISAGLAAGSDQLDLLMDNILKYNIKTKDLSAIDVAKDEDFWFWVQHAYTSSPNIINLNNGGVSPQPLVVQNALDKYNRFANEGPAYYMWKIVDAGREPIRKKLAELAGASPEEIAICRNTTEALDNIIFGLNLKAGDEVVLSKQDYPNMINAWKQREKRDGIILKWVDMELPIEDDDKIVNQYKALFTDKTKVVHITHMINWTGQILPVKKIADEARKRGIESIADGAHTFAHIKYKIPDLGCDYFGTSLHKWLCAPFGTGFLYVRREKIKDLWALMPNHLFEEDDIMKFEGLGTRSMPAEMAIGHAIEFHKSIGIDRKEARLRYLKNYWAERAKEIKGVKIHTSFKEPYACALALFSIDDKSPQDIANYLFKEHKVYVISIEWENIKGIRVTPHVYTKLSDLDQLLFGIENYIHQKN